MKTLEQHQADMLEYYANREKSWEYGKPSGVKCPECSGQLFFVEPMFPLIDTHPPEKLVECNKCDHRLYITV